MTTLSDSQSGREPGIVKIKIKNIFLKIRRALLSFKMNEAEIELRRLAEIKRDD